MKPATILYIHSSANLYGSDQLLLRLVANLDRHRFRPIILVPEDGPLVTAFRQLGVDVHIKPLHILHRTLNPLYWLRFLIGLPLSVLALRQFIKREDIQLVHSNTSHVFDGGLAARAAGVAHVWHIREIHTGLSKIGSPLSRLIYACSDKIIAMSNAARQAFFARYPDSEKIEVVFDGVDIGAFSPANDGLGFRVELGLSPETPLVGLVGRVAHWKGHRVFLQAARLVRAHRPDTRFLIVGDAVTPGDQRLKKDLLELIGLLGLEEIVIFTGLRADIPQVMAALDVFVLASELPEPWGMVVLEAMASAKPVVATRQGGPLESILDGETGYLVLPGEAEPMAQAILKLLADHEKAAAMGRAGRVRCEQLFTEADSCQEIMNLYEALLQKNIGAVAKQIWND